MKRFLGMMLLAVVMGGCVPERVVWSPDGSRAAVLGEDGLHVCDADGNLGPVLSPKVIAAQWMPDGKGVVVDEEEELKTWKEVQAAFPDEVDRVVNRQREEAVRAALVGFTGDWGDMKGELEKKTSLEDKEVTWNLMALRDQDDGTLQKQLGDHWGAVAAMTFGADAVRIYHIDGGEVTAGSVLRYMFTEGMHELRISPDGRAVAITWTDKNGDRAVLTVVATDGSGRELELGLAAMYPDWSADGKYVVYMRPSGSRENGPQQAQFGTLSRMAVWGADGKLLEKPVGPEDLAGLLFDTQMRVRAGKDGRIFFMSAEVSLPVTAADFDPKPQLFCIDPGRQATVSRVVPRSELGKVGDAPQYFEISPDGMRISTPWQDGRVSVIDLATGSATIVQGTAFPGSENNGDKLTSVPTWRSANELTFMRPAGDLAEVVRYSVADQKVVVLSKEWPREATKDWLWHDGPASTTRAP